MFQTVKKQTVQKYGEDNTLYYISHMVCLIHITIYISQINTHYGYANIVIF